MEMYAPCLFLVAAVYALFLLSRMDGRLDRTEKMLARLLHHLNVDFDVIVEPSDAVKRLAADPESKIAAIKAYREQTGLGLKPAKAVIESLAAAGVRADA